jgi:DNA-binding transcriptional LysR family regulator
MHDINLPDIDLNLLVALEALLQEQHVTRAARRLGRSQPAASHALSRLRELFDDPLLVSGAGGMQPTPLAESLLEPLERALRQVESVLVTERGFDQATTTRSFSLGCPDLLATFLPSLLTWMEGQAPGATMEVDSPYLDNVEDDLGKGRFDVIIAPIPDAATSRIRQRRVGAVRWYCLMRPGHPALDAEWGLESWVSYPHVVVRQERAGVNLIDVAIEAAGLSREIGLTIPQFLLGPPAVETSNLIYAAPHILAADAVERYDLVARPLPVDPPPVDAAVLWHERWDADDGHRWFRTGIWEALKTRWDVVPDSEA